MGYQNTWTGTSLGRNAYGSVCGNSSKCQTSIEICWADSPHHFDIHMLVHFAELMQGIETDRLLRMIPEELLSDQRRWLQKSAYSPNPKPSAISEIIKICPMCH